MLLKRGLSQALLDAKLVTIEGNAKDPEAVRNVLLAEKDQLVDHIVFSIGGQPKLALNPLKPLTLDDPTVCQDSMLNVSNALRTIASSNQASKMPLLIAVSSTGVSESRDVPIVMKPVYVWGLAVPHADKRALEKHVVEAKEEKLIRDFVIIRPSHLTDDQTNGKIETKVGWEGKAPGTVGEGAAIGYKITREDVGFFIFERVIADDGGEFVGKKVSITH
ncbi:MAG: hypothetical protein Q9219_002392 [cf. Caloplaca sp. 3 TL-2023]